MNKRDLEKLAKILLKLEELSPLKFSVLDKVLDNNLDYEMSQLALLLDNNEKNY